MLTIAVFPNTNKPEAPRVLQRILDFYADKDVRIIMPVEEARIFQHAGYGVTDIENVKTDIALSIGGDGTLLGVCRRYSHHAVPVCGVNIGTLGFMADIELHELEKKLQKLLDGDYRIEHRLLLAGSVISGGKERFLGHAINDIVVKGGVANVRALIVTPICAHTFNIRPLIIQEDDAVHVAIASIPQDIIVTFDGQVCYRLLPGDEVVVRKSEAQAEIIKFEDKDYYQILRTKLWRPAGE